MFKQKKKLVTLKRALAFMLSVVMIFSLVPESAFIAKAEELTWVDGTTVSTTTEGVSYYFDIASTDAYVAEGTYGLMTVDHGSSNAMAYHGTTYGVYGKAGNNFTFQVPGNCYIVVSGDNNSSEGATITATSSTGTFETDTLATKTSGHCDLEGVKTQGDNSVSFTYSGSAGTVTLTINESTAYICAFAIIPIANQDEDGDGWVDGTTVSNAIKGNSYYFDIASTDAYVAEGTYGLMTVDHGSSNAMAYHGTTYGVYGKAGNNFTFKVPGNSYIVVSGDNNSSAGATITATSSTGAFETATLATKTSGHCDLEGVKTQGANAVSFLYVGDAGTVTLTINESTAYICAFAIIPASDDISLDGDDDGSQDEDGDGWVDGTTVSTTEDGLSYYFDIATTDAYVAEGTYGLMTVDHGSSNAMAYHGTTYGVYGKAGNNFTFQVPGNCYVVVSGDNNSSAGATITATSSTGTFEEATLATKTSGHCDLNGVKTQGDNSVSFVYTGSAGTVTLTINESTAYICAFAIIPVENQDPDGDGWVDGTGVSNAIKGNSYYFDIASTSNYVAEGTYGLMTVDHGSSNAMTYHGTTYGVYGKAGNNFTFQVPGNCYIVVSGDNNSSAGATITATSSTGAFEEDTLATKTSGHCDLEGVKTQGDNSVSFLYVGTAGTVTLTINESTAYICAFAIIPASDDIVLEETKYATVSGSVDATLNGEKLVFSDGTDTFDATVENGVYSVQLPIGSNYTLAFEKGIYSITSNTSLDLSSTAEGATVTNNITYTELENRLVLDAAQTVWNFTDSSFAGYGKDTDWYSGDGLVIGGKITYNGGQHGANIASGNTFSINVPAGQTTITLGVCAYGSATGTITCGSESKDLTLNGGGANDGADTTVIFTNDEEATIVLTITGGGYLHNIKAKTETVQPSATVSGTVDASVNGEELQFLVGEAPLATTTIANGAYSVDLPIGNKYTVAFTNADLYEVTGGTTVDLTNVAAGTSASNNITFKKWDVTKVVTLTLGDTTFTVTPGADKSENFTVAATSGTGSVEVGNNEKTIVWTNLGGQGGGVLSSDKITNVSNATTTFSGNTLTIKYTDTTTNPSSYQLIVKDNSATGVAVADGSTVEYSLGDESIVSSMYTNANRLSGGKSVSSTDKIVTLTGNSGIYYNGSHGIYINANDTISVNVAGDATVSFSVCAYSASDGLLTATCADTNGAITPTSGSAKAASDGDLVTFEYTGDATTLTFTYTGGTGYIHNIAVKNKAQASDVANVQAEMPEVKTTVGTASSLEALPVGQRFMFTQTGGRLTTDEVNGGIDTSVSYFGFPETAGKYKLEADIILSTCGSSNYNGIYFGAFDDDYIATVGIRNSTGLRGILSKSSLDMAGASTVDETIEKGQKVHFTAEKTDACFVITATPEGGETFTMEFDYNDSGVLLFKEQGINTPISFGFAIAGSSAIVTNMKYYNASGTLVYDQNDCYDPVGTAPIVASVAAEAASTREYITVNWTSSVAVVGDGRYVVQVSKDGSAYTTIDETTATSIDYPISEAGTYTFRVAGKLGEEGETNTWVYSSPLTVIAALTKPVVSISASASAVTLSWDAVDKANKYEVYRYSYDEGEENASVIATLTSTSYIDSNVSAEMPYYYYVVAYSTDNYSNPSEAVWAVPSAGHTGTYVYEDEATEIFITKKSYDTVFDGLARFEGIVMGNGTIQAVVNGDVLVEQDMTANGRFSWSVPLNEGRNDVNLLFTDGNGKVTRKTYNFVYLTNYDIVVDAAYTGTEGATVNGIPTYSTVQGAVDAASAGNVILVMAGSYEERLVVNKANISIIGEDREATLIHCYPGDLGSDYEAGQDMTKRCATYIEQGASGFSAENISFANDYVYSTPDGKSNKSADALRCDADSASFVNVKFSSVQDTLYMGKGHQYYYKCVIEGLVDFIYSGDDARAFFNDCEIVFVYESTKKGGYVCAPKTDEDATYGLTFYNCVITAEEGCSGNGYLLARPWGPDAYITWINCYMGDVVYDVLPYGDMSGNPYVEARFFEYGSYGPGYAINVDRRQISPSKASEMISDAFLGWSPASVSAAVAANYVGDIATDRAPQYNEQEYTGSDKYQWTDGNDTGLAKYNQEGYAQAYGVSGGGLLLETSENYYKVASAEEFLDALLAVKESGKKSVIELTADINLGCKEIENFDNYSDIIEAYKAQPLTHPTLIESGVSVLSIEDMYNLTIFSQNGSSIKHANITMKNAGNIIIRNIKFDELWEWDEDTDGNYDRNDWDFMTIDSACDGVWIDHCTFYKAYDGIVDMKNPANEMNVTVSWCEFLAGSENDTFFNVMMDELKNNASNYPYYSSLLSKGMTEEQIYMYAYGQKKTHLLGQSDSAENAVGIRATFANNVYTDSMDRMPRLRYGVSHVYNCIMDAQTLLDVRKSITNEDIAKKIVSNGAASTCGAQVLLENCYISGIQNALNSGNGSSPSGYINAINSVYYMDGVKTTLAPKANSTTDTRVLVTDADEFISNLTYGDYVLCDAELLDEYVAPYAGAGKLALTVLQWEKSSYNDSQPIVMPDGSVEEDDEEDDDDDDDDTAVESPVVTPGTASTQPTKKPSLVIKPVTSTIKKDAVKAEIGSLSEYKIPDAVAKKIGCTTVEDLEAFLKAQIVEASKNKVVFEGIESEATSVIDITIMISEDGGKTWTPATAENFPKEGVDVVIPYPEGIDKESHDFVVGHLVTMGINGAEIGSMEYYTPMKTAEGLEIHITSASPFVVGWKSIKTEATTTPVVEPEKVVEDVVVAPETEVAGTTAEGPNVLIMVLCIAIILIGAAAGVVVYQKKNKK